MTAQHTWERPSQRVEYALRVNCERAGCATPHGDNGEIYPAHIHTNGEPHRTLNGHPADLLRRTITTSDWTEEDA